MVQLTTFRSMRRLSGIQGDSGPDLDELERLTRELQQRDAQLAESERRFRTLAEISMDAIVICGPDQVVLFSNDAADKMFGAPLRGKHLSTIVPSAHASQHSAAYSRAAREGESSDYLRRYQRRTAVRADGREIEVEYSVAAWEEEGIGRVFSAVLRDVTEAEEAERYRRAMLHLTEAYLDISPSIYVVLNKAGDIVFCNNALKVAVGAIEGRSFRDMIHPDDVERVSAEFERLARDAAPGTKSSYLNRIGSGGHYVWVLWTNTTVRRDGMVAVIASGIVIEDIDELIRTAQLQQERVE